MTYRDAAGLYWNAGWKGILPLPAGRKEPVPTGYTGYKGAWPSWEDISAWVQSRPGGNIALRMPNTVVGIDVDAYGDKKGNACLEHAESLYGPLPATVRSTSRLDGISGIRLFKVPAGTELNTVITFPDLGLDGIETCQFFHRYVVAWPSIHPSTERVYRWLDADGHILTEVPRIGSLPDLPQAWIDGLRRSPQQNAEVNADVHVVMASLPAGPMTIKVRDRLTQAVALITNAAGGRHDNACREVLALFRLAEQGHTGVEEALDTLGTVFVEAIVSDGSRDEESAEAEWGRIVYGQRGHDLIASNPTPATLEDLLGKKPVNTLQKHTSEDESSFKALGFEHHEYDMFGEEPDLFDRILLQQEQGANESQTSWGPIDLAVILDGDLSPIEPTILHRDDGKAIFYAGHVNALVGESESGKSWLGLMACVEEMNAARNVVFIDFEDSPRNVVSRLLALGLSKEAVRRHFDYVGPDTTLGPVEKEELFALLDTKHPSLIILDGVNAAMSLLGLDLEKNKEATQFYQWILKPLASTGATIVTVDHVTKDPNARGLYAIGAQAKRAMADGAMLGVNTVDRFGRGRIGKLNIEVLKDRNGGVLALSEKRGDSRREYLCSAIIDAREEGKVKTRLVFESDKIVERDVVRTRMHEVSCFVRDNKDVVRTKIIKSLEGSHDVTKEAVDNLLAQGYLVERVGVATGRNETPSRYYTLVHPYDSPDTQAIREMIGDEEH